MKVLITLNKTNTGRIQLTCTKSTNERGGIGRTYSLSPFNPNAVAEIEELIRCLGVDEDSTRKGITQLSQARQGELVRVADLEVPNEILSDNGFVGVT